jgi:hypothetical protein
MKIYLQNRINDLDQISRLLCAGVTLAIIGLWSMYFFHGTNPFCNETTLLLGSLLLFILIAEAFLVDASLKSPVIVLVFLQASAFIPGVFSLLLIPDTVFTPLTLDGVTQVNEGLSYLCVGSLAFCLCFLLANYLGTANREILFYGQTHKMESSHYEGRGILALLSAMMVVVLLSKLPFWLGISQYFHGQSVPILWNTILQLQVLLFDPDSITLLAAYSASRMNITPKWRLQLLVMISCIYLAASISGGSRSGLMRLLIFSLVIALALEVRVKVKWKTIGTYLGVLIAGCLVVFVLATHVRLKLASAEYLSMNGVPLIEETVAKPDSTEQSSMGIHPDLAKALARGVFSEIASRLAVPFFSAIQATTHEANNEARQRYFSIEYTIKSVANNLPGTPFPEAELGTSRLFGVIYREETEEQVLQHGYFSEFYTAWGLSYLFFGRLGGLFALALSGFLLAFAFAFVYKKRQEYPALQLWALFILPGSILFTQGLDHTLWLWMVTGLRIAISAYILKSFFNMFEGVGVASISDNS